MSYYKTNYFLDARPIECYAERPNEPQIFE